MKRLALVVLLGTAVLASAQTGRDRVPAPRPALPPARAWKFEWTDDGRLLSRTDPAGRQAKYSYRNGRLREVAYGDGTRASYSYHDGGARSAMDTAGWGETRYDYDALGLPRAVTPPHGPKVSYRFQAGGQLRRLELSDGWWVSYDYDLMNRPVTVESQLGKVTYEYFPNDRRAGGPEPRTVRRLPNGVTTTWSFDADLRLIELRHERSGRLLAGWRYRHDAAGRVETLTDARADKERRLVYDSLGRLRKVLLQGKPEEAYDYDPGSNQTRVQRGGESLEFGYDPLGQLQRVNDERLNFGPAGELVKRASGKETQEFAYDPDGKLKAVTGGGLDLRYVYDGDGTLVERRKGRAVERYVYDVSATVPQLLAVSDEQGEPLTHYLLAPGRLAVQDRAGKVAWLLEDHLGSVRLLTDQEGEECGRNDYHAFGHLSALPAASANIGFAGEWRDPDTGLIYLRARWYDPALGRFLSPDLRWGTPEHLASWNRYAYAANDPVNAVDPTGLSPWDPPPPPPPVYSPQEMQRLLARAAATRVFPSASRPLDFSFLRPDYAVFEAGTPLSVGGGSLRAGGIEVGPLQAGFAGGLVVDRTGRLYAGGSFGASLNYLPVKAGVYHVMGPPLSAGELHDFIAGKSFGANLLAVEYVRSQGRNAVGLVAGPWASVSFGRTEGAAELMPGLGTLLEQLRPTRPRSLQGYSGLLVSDLAPTLAGSPYKLYSREHGEAQAADYCERAARADPMSRSRLWVDWVMGAEYSGIDQVRGAGGSLAPPARAFSGGDGNVPTPRVGGVYLDAVAEVLGDVGRLRGAVYDRENNRLVLLTDGKATPTSRLRADDLAVALRAVAAGELPGFSIDPNPDDPRGKLMMCRYIGPTEGTHFGLVMYQADRLLKDVGRGEDERGRELRPKVKGFQDLFELGFEHNKGGGPQGKVRWTRYWFVPARVEWEVSPDGNTLWCGRARMTVKAQVCKLNEKGQMEDLKGETDAAADAYASFFTDHYDELVDEFPVLEELRQLAQVVGFAGWLKKQLPSETFESLVTSLVPPAVTTPKTTPGTTLYREKVIPAGKRTLQHYGGVEMRVEVPDAPPSRAELAGFLRAVHEVLPVKPMPAAADVRVGDLSCRAVAVPLVPPSAVGSLTLRATDLSLPLPGGPVLALTRHYNSTRTEPGAFGRGWHLLVPELVFRGAGEKKALVITDAWGSFERPVRGPSFLKFQPGPDGYTITGADGSVLTFGPHRKLTRYQAGGVEWLYGYEGGRLRDVTVRRGRETLARVELTYNKLGQVDMAKGGERTVRYEYDAAGRLVKVRSGDESMTYVYDARHHLESVEGAGGKTTFACSSDGQLTRGPAGVNEAVEYKRERTPEGGTRVRVDGPDGFDVVLDGHGRVVEATRAGLTLRQQWKDGERVREVVADGQVVVRARGRKGGDKVELEFPQDGRHEVYHLQPDGTLRDGRLERGREGMDIAFDGRGRPVGLRGPAGEVYEEKSPRPGSREIVTPTGTYSLEGDADGNTVKLRSPSGKQWTWGLGPDKKVSRIGQKDTSVVREWAKTGPDSWQLKEGEKVIAQLRTDKEGRVVETRDQSGVTVTVDRGDGGSVVKTGEGRQLQVRRDAKGRLLEVREFPVGADPVPLPLPDLTGNSKVQEKQGKLLPVKKE